jgi:membrane protease YdiL (CAAX protease family)
MRQRHLKIITGFIILFGLYHAAEYMIVFKNSALGFLGVQLLFFLSAWGLAKWQTGQGFSTWGLDIKRSSLKHLFSGMLMGAILYGSYFFLSLVMGSEKLKTLPSLFSTFTPFLLFAFGCFFSSFSEDILTRGYLYYHFNGKLTNWLLALFSALVYVLNHIYRLHDGPEGWLYLFALGLTFVTPLILTKKLWFTGGLHWTGNVVFYLTHEIIKTESVTGSFPSNYILMFCALLLIPMTYAVLHLFQLRPKMVTAGSGQKSF